MQHLVDRMDERVVGQDALVLLTAWLDTKPEVPDGEWWHRFPDIIFCGEGELPKTFLELHQIPYGTEV